VIFYLSSELISTKTRLVGGVQRGGYSLDIGQKAVFVPAGANVTKVEADGKAPDRMKYESPSGNFQILLGNRGFERTAKEVLEKGFSLPIASFLGEQEQKARVRQ
jgi:hypothetical protein